MQKPPTGVTDRAVLARLVQGAFLGSAAELASEIRCQERFVWLAIAGLAEREQVKAQRTATGTSAPAQRRSRAASTSRRCWVVW